MSYAGLGQVSATVGRDGTRHESGGSVRVSARWAQRAANAGLRFDRTPPLAPLIGVDGRAGSVTIGALRALSHRMIATADGPVLNDPPLSGTTRWSPNVIMSTALESALARLAPVSDPPLSSATRRTTTGATGAPTTAPIPGADPVAPADEIILDEGSSGGGGLIARYGIWPWAIGGTALVGVGLWFMMGSGAGASVRANRRRVRRNSKHKIRRSSVPWNYPCPGCGATELGKFGHGAGCKLAHHRLAGTFSVPKRKKSVRRNSGSWIVAIGNRGEYLAFYDYSAISGVGDYGVTKSQRDALHFRKYDHAASAANSISSGGGPSTRVVQPGEGVRRNSSQGALEAKADELELERAALMRRAKKPGTPIDEKRSLNKRIYELIDEIAELGDRAETLRSAPR